MEGSEGIADGSLEGDCNCEGMADGSLDGDCIGIMDGSLEGDCEGIAVGDFDGDFKGIKDGSLEGNCDCKGIVEGSLEGEVLREELGTYRWTLYGSITFCHRNSQPMQFFHRFVACCWRTIIVPAVSPLFRGLLLALLHCPLSCPAMVIPHQQVPDR